MPRRIVALAIVCLGLISLAATCGKASPDITVERAIEIAKTHVTFEIASIDTKKVTEAGRPAWSVTLRGKPASAEFPELRAIVIVIIDRRTGEVISVAKS